MKINAGQTQMLFKDVPIGTVFNFNGWYDIKIQPIYNIIKEERNALELGKCLLVQIRPDAVVTIFPDAEIQL